MTYEDVKRIRENPDSESPDNKELSKLIDEAVKKQIPQKPLRGYTCKANNDSWRSCPFCHARQWDTHKYCSQCGQALDWGD